MRLLDYGQISSFRGDAQRSFSAHVLTQPTLGMVGHAKLEALCEALDMNSELGSASRLFDLLGASWAGRRLRSAHPASDITDDSSPFEFSLAVEDGAPELRMLVEAQGRPFTPAANWVAAWRLTEQLGQTYGVSLDRARQIADLFEPNHETRVFSLWHAACLRPGRAPTLKLYFNPMARGEAGVDATMKEAFARLGQSDCYEWIREHAMLRGDQDRFAYMSLDLGNHAEARTKVYIAHRNATSHDAERVMAAVAGHVAGDAVDFCDAMVGNHGPFNQRPLLTCMAFVAGKPAPSTVTLHLPIRCYAPNDQVVLERVGKFLSPVEAGLHERAVRSMASRPLEAGAGMQTYTSFRRVEGRKRLTVYLSPEVYHAR
jgi:DMATS type aromatic prenyltransferase